MANTTKILVFMIAPELEAAYSGLDDIVTQILTDVAQAVSYSVYGIEQERAQRYLAAHYLTLSNPTLLNRDEEANAVGPMTAHKVGDISKNYGGILSAIKDVNRYDETKYGRAFNQIRKQCVVPFKVVKPA